MIAVTAGLRIGELLGFRWQDVDLESATLRVRRTKSTAKTGPRFTEPKNRKGRSIRLTSRVVDALSALIRRPRMPNARRPGAAGRITGSSSLPTGDGRSTPVTRSGPHSSRSSRRPGYRIYASTTSGTRAPRCYSPGATIPSSFRISWGTPPWPYPRQILPRPARHGRPDGRRNGGRAVLKNLRCRGFGPRWCTRWCSKGRERSRPSSLSGVSPANGRFGAEEEGFEPSIPR